MKPPYKTMPGLAVAAIASLSFLGCGSDGGETSPALSRAQLTNKVNQICTKQLEEKEEILSVSLKKLSDGGATPSGQEVEDLVQSLLPPFQHMSEELSELPASEEDEEAVEDFAAALDAGVEKVEADPGRFAKSNPFEAAGKVALENGFKACSL